LGERLDGDVMRILQIVLYYVLYLYLVVLIGRMIFSIVQAFAREWQPHGVLLVAAESIYTVTDPPLKFLRSFIKPVRIGAVSLDLSFMVLYLVILILLVEAVPHL
jgi:YggT family protein